MNALPMILLLGGTDEARKLAEMLSTRSDLNLTVSLAGLTPTPKPYQGATRIGGFGGSAGMIAWMRQHHCTALIDATHPFATQIKAHASLAAESLNLPYCLLLRPAWKADEAYRWQECSDLPSAITAIPSGARVFVATGRKTLSHFAQRDDVTWIARVLNNRQTLRATPPPANVQLISGEPSRWPSQERQLLEALQITHILTKNSGGCFGMGKILAARKMGIPIVIITRPPLPKGPCVDTPEAALAFIEQTLKIEKSP